MHKCIQLTIRWQWFHEPPIKWRTWVVIKKNIGGWKANEYVVSVCVSYKSILNCRTAGFVSFQKHEILLGSICTDVCCYVKFGISIKKKSIASFIVSNVDPRSVMI